MLFFCCFVLCIYMLLAGWEVRIGKNFDRGPENAARGRRPRAAFSSPRSQFYLYGPTLSRPITFFLSILAVNSLTSGLRAVYNSNHSQKTNERTNEQIRYYRKKDLLKNRFISNYFMLVHLVPQLRSPKLFSRYEISCKV